MINAPMMRMNIWLFSKTYPLSESDSVGMSYMSTSHVIIIAMSVYISHLIDILVHDP